MVELYIYIYTGLIMDWTELVVAAFFGSGCGGAGGVWLKSYIYI